MTTDPLDLLADPAEPDGHVEIDEQPDGAVVAGEPYPILTQHA